MVVKVGVFGTPESVVPQVAGSYSDDTLAALQPKIHNDLRGQHSEWVESNGDCPMCDLYEARLVQLLEVYAQTGSDESAAAVHRALQEAATLYPLR